MVKDISMRRQGRGKVEGRGRSWSARIIYPAPTSATRPFSLLAVSACLLYGVRMVNSYKGVSSEKPHTRIDNFVPPYPSLLPLVGPLMTVWTILNSTLSVEPGSGIVDEEVNS